MSPLSRATPAVIRPKTDAIPMGPPLVLTDAEAEGLARILARPPKPNAKLKAAFARHAPRKSNTYLQERCDALLCALTTPAVATYEEPAELVNRSNGSQGISVKGMHARAASRKAQRAIGGRIARAFIAYEFRGITAERFAVVVLTRVAPRSLDSDGLETAFKSIRDGIAEGLGISDASPLVRYVCSQERGEPRQHLVRAQLFIQPTKEKSP